MEIIGLTGLNINAEWFRTPCQIMAFVYFTCQKMQTVTVMVTMLQRQRDKMKSCCDFTILAGGRGGHVDEVGVGHVITVRNTNNTKSPCKLN